MLKFIPASTLIFRDNNDVDAWVPEHWANESLVILEENMVIANLVHRDFEDEIAEAGDVVNTRKPDEFEAERKDVDDEVTEQSATATNIPVPLNQHLHTTFIIKDKEASQAFQDLVVAFLQPAVLSIAQAVDKILLGQAPRFLRSDGATAGVLGTDIGINEILDARNNLNLNKAPASGRNFILTPKDETALLKLEQFTSAEKVGDAGTALREASLGRKYGFDMFMAQNTSYVTAGSDSEAGAINNAGGYAAGHAAAMTVDGFTSTLIRGTWVKIAGDDVPHRLAAVSGTPTTSITLDTPLKNAVVDNAVITAYLEGAINNGAGYAANWSKAIAVDGFTRMPQVGQMVSLLAAAGPLETEEVYVVIKATATTITLDRPLAKGFADNDHVAIGPDGSYNFAFLRNAIAFVSRPLALPMEQSGARGAVASFGGLSIRVVWQYDSKKQGMRVTVDILCGVAILDQLLGEVCLG